MYRKFIIADVKHFRERLFMKLLRFSFHGLYVRIFLIYIYIFFVSMATVWRWPFVRPCTERMIDKAQPQGCVNLRREGVQAI